MSVRGARGEDELHKRKTNESPCVGSRAHYDGRGEARPLASPRGGSGEAKVPLPISTPTLGR